MGVWVNVGTQNKISKNSIFQNGANQSHLGIDLDGDGVTTNDNGDVDPGPNNKMNFPEIDLAQKIDNTSVHVEGTLNTQASAYPVTIEFFNADGDPSGHGEGKVYLNSITLNAGSFNTDISWVSGATLGSKVTATATDKDGNTSEFALNETVMTNLPPPSPPSNSITVEAPNGGENWSVGNTGAITWTSSGDIVQVKIELSRNGPAGPYELLFANTVNDGSENWTVTGPASANAFVKISDAADEGISDTSNSAFTISQPASSITVIAPNGGETWAIGSTQTIQWSSTGLTGNVEIRLSLDGGRNFPEVLFADTANDGNQTWVVTGFATRGAFIKITSRADPTVSDTSNSFFTIQ